MGEVVRLNTGFKAGESEPPRLHASEDYIDVEIQRAREEIDNIKQDLQLAELSLVALLERRRKLYGY